MQSDLYSYILCNRCEEIVAKSLYLYFCLATGGKERGWSHWDRLEDKSPKHERGLHAKEYANWTHFQRQFSNNRRKFRWRWHKTSSTNISHNLSSRREKTTTTTNISEFENTKTVDGTTWKFCHSSVVCNRPRYRRGLETLATAFLHEKTTTKMKRTKQNKIRTITTTTRPLIRLHTQRHLGQLAILPHAKKTNPANNTKRNAWWTASSKHD